MYTSLPTAHGCTPVKAPPATMLPMREPVAAYTLSLLNSLALDKNKPRQFNLDRIQHAQSESTKR